MSSSLANVSNGIPTTDILSPLFSSTPIILDTISSTCCRVLLFKFPLIATDAVILLISPCAFIVLDSVLPVSYSILSSLLVFKFVSLPPTVFILLSILPPAASSCDVVFSFLFSFIATLFGSIFISVISLVSKFKSEFTFTTTLPDPNIDSSTEDIALSKSEFNSFSAFLAMYSPLELVACSFPFSSYKPSDKRFIFWSTTSTFCLGIFSQLAETKDIIDLTWLISKLSPGFRVIVTAADPGWVSLANTDSSPFIIWTLASATWENVFIVFSISPCSILCFFILNSSSVIPNDEPSSISS